MRWLAFAILAYLLLAVQVGLGGYLSWRGAAPNLILLGVVFVCINAPREPALLGAFMLGMAQDLFTQQPFGLCALTYGLIGLLITANQHMLYREHPGTHLLMALVGGLIAAGVFLAHAWLYARLHEMAGPVRPPPLRLGPLLLSAGLTAEAAVPVLFVLQKCKGVFGFRPARQPTMQLRSRRR